MNRAFHLNHIDWEPADPIRLSPGSAAFLDTIRENDWLPIVNGKIRFSDSVWDFGPYHKTKHISNSKKRFHFNGIGKAFTEVLKSIVLLMIIDGENKIQTIQSTNQRLMNFIRYVESRGTFYPGDVTLEMVRSYMDGKRPVLNESSYYNCFIVLKKFFTFYWSLFKQDPDPSIDSFFKNDKQLLLRARICADASRQTTIPQVYFNQVMESCLKSLYDETEKEILRATACMIIILSQTGIRTSELTSLRLGAIREQILKGNIRSYSLEYDIFKTAKSDGNFIKVQTVANELTKTAYDKLVELHQKNRTGLDTDYLFCPAKASPPVRSEKFSRYTTAYYFIHQDRINCIDSRNKYPELNCLPVKKIIEFCKVKKYLHGGDLFVYPKNHQYRVHLCTELYNKGVPLTYIQKYMSHLTSSMTAHYIRISENNLKTDTLFAGQIIREITEGEATLTGPNASYIEKKINDFLMANKLNTEKDIDSVIDKLLKEIPIRAKRGGVCIKHSIRECLNDKATNEVLCAYDVCPNLYHLYYMIPITYLDFKDIRVSYNYNKECGFFRESEKELKKLNYIAKNRLVPQLDDLQKQIADKGLETILSKHPELKQIADNIENIYTEIKQWIP